jgi:hypothetical protein
VGQYWLISTPSHGFGCGFEAVRIKVKVLIPVQTLKFETLSSPHTVNPVKS